jgi:hypothetical protein
MNKTYSTALLVASLFLAPLFVGAQSKCVGTCSQDGALQASATSVKGGNSGSGTTDKKDISPDTQSLLDKLKALQAQLAAIRAQVESGSKIPTGGTPTNGGTPNLGGIGGFGGSASNGTVTSSQSTKQDDKVCSNLFVPRYLTRGNSSEAVKDLQRFLVREGKLDASMVSGFFGDNTYRALGEWQVEEGVVTGPGAENGWGVFGEKTRAAVMRSCGKPSTTLGAGDSPVSYTISDVLKVTKELVNPKANVADDEYTLYTITLKSGRVVKVKACLFCLTVAREKNFTESGYKGDVSALIKLAIDGITATPTFSNVTTKSCNFIRINGLINDTLTLSKTATLRPELTWQGAVVRTPVYSADKVGGGPYKSTSKDTRWSGGNGLIILGPNGDQYKGLDDGDGNARLAKSTVSSPEYLHFAPNTPEGKYTVIARHIGDATMTSYVCSKTFNVVTQKTETSATSTPANNVSEAQLFTTKFISASSTIVRVTGLPSAVKKKFSQCEYGWNQRAGSGITVDWGDGAVFPGSYDDKAAGTPCVGLTSHEYKHGAPDTSTYTIRMRTWHAGPTDVPVTDWEGSTKVTIR